MGREDIRIRYVGRPDRLSWRDGPVTRAAASRTGRVSGQRGRLRLPVGRQSCDGVVSRRPAHRLGQIASGRVYSGPLIALTGRREPILLAGAARDWGACRDRAAGPTAAGRRHRLRH